VEAVHALSTTVEDAWLVNQVDGKGGEGQDMFSQPGSGQIQQLANEPLLFSHFRSLNLNGIWLWVAA
jgi:hypothetical protein